MARPASRVQLCIDLAGVRSQLAKLRKQLPKAPGSVRTAPHDMAAAYWLERAAWCITQAEQAWDD